LALVRYGAPKGVVIGNEACRLLTARKWRMKHFRSSWDKAWIPGDSIRLAIVQKDLTVTPPQMARFYALLANGGKLVTPYVIASADRLGAKNEPPVVLQQFAPTPPQSAGGHPLAVDVIGPGLYAP